MMVLGMDLRPGDVVSVIWPNRVKLEAKVVTVEPGNVLDLLPPDLRRHSKDQPCTVCWVQYHQAVRVDVDGPEMKSHFGNVFVPLEARVDVKKKECKMKPEIEAPDVIAVREIAAMDQRTFALVLGVSERTVRGWETGATIPASAQFTLRLFRHCQLFLEERKSRSDLQSPWSGMLREILGKADA